MQLARHWNTYVDNIGADHAVLIIRHDNCIHRGQDLAYVVENLSFAWLTDLGSVHAVDTHNVLLDDLRASRHNACLGRSRARGISDKALLVHAQLADGSTQTVARNIIAYDARQEDLCA